MHIKKRAEDDIKKTIRLSFARSKVKVNTKVEAAVAESPNQIKGKAIPGIKKYNAIASGKGE
jgi:ATP-binding protein involved in chromosome partitioning